MKSLSFFALLLLFCGCSSVNYTPPSVGSFDLERYLGRWYEIARITNAFERDMHYVYTDYSLREDGGVKVINSGVRDGQRRFVKAQAYLLGDGDKAELKISFFWPFYGSYRVIYLEDDYSVAMVTSGNNREYFWILARNPIIKNNILKRYLKFAEKCGFDRKKIEFPKPYIK